MQWDMIHTLCFLIDKNIYNLFSICDQTFVSTQYKTKLHQHQRFCILSAGRSRLHLSKSKHYIQNNYGFEYWLKACEGLVGNLVFWAESTTKDYITAKNNVQSVCYLLCTQVIKPEIIHKPQNQTWHKFTQNKTYTNIRHKIFKELVPSISPLLKKHIRLGHAGIVDHSVDLAIPDF